MKLRTKLFLFIILLGCKGKQHKDPANITAQVCDCFSACQAGDIDSRISPCLNKLYKPAGKRINRENRSGSHPGKYPGGIG